jgi:hypothetical protein
MSERIKTRRMLPHIVGKQGIVESIQAYLNDRTGLITLTPKQEEMYERIKFAKSYLLKFHSKDETAQMLTKEYDISESTAYQMVRHVFSIYGDITATDKKWSRSMASKMALQTFRTAQKENDLAAMNAATRNFTIIEGLDREDPDAPDFSKLESKPVYLVPSEATEKFIEQIAGSLLGGIGKSAIMDFSNLFKDAENAEFEEIEGEEVADE